MFLTFPESSSNQRKLVARGMCSGQSPSSIHLSNWIVFTVRGLWQLITTNHRRESLTSQRNLAIQYNNNQTLNTLKRGFHHRLCCWHDFMRWCTESSCAPFVLFVARALKGLQCKAMERVRLCSFTPYLVKLWNKCIPRKRSVSYNSSAGTLRKSPPLKSAPNYQKCAYFVQSQSNLHEIY